MLHLENGEIHNISPDERLMHIKFILHLANKETSHFQLRDFNKVHFKLPLPIPLDQYTNRNRSVIVVLTNNLLEMRQIRIKNQT